MELKFKEMNEDFIVNVGALEVLLKPFYTSDEEYSIYVDMKDKDNAFYRKISKVVLTGKFCTNIDFGESSDKEIYDICSKLGLIDVFELEIQGYNDFDKMIQQDESSYKALSMLVDSLSQKLDGFNPEEITQGFSKLGDVLDGNRHNK